MNRKVSKIIVMFLVFLCLNSLIYYDIPDIDSSEKTELLDLLLDIPSISSTISQSAGDDFNKDIPLLNSETPGSWQNFAFFPGGTGQLYGLAREAETLIFDPADEDPYHSRNIFEWVTYDEIKDDATLNKEMYWRTSSDATHTWANDTDWFYLREKGYPYEPSKVYSPVFTEEYEITGKVYFMSYLTINYTDSFSQNIDIDYRQSLYLFDPALPSNLTTIARRTNSSDIHNFPDEEQITYSTELESPGTFTIPVGYRLRWDIEVRFSTVPALGSVMQNSGYPFYGGGTTVWTIDDDPTYDATYTLNNCSRMAGIQLRMRSKEFPDINVTNIANNTVHQTSQAINIDVTDGSTSSYSWDGNPSVVFDNETITNLPTTFHGWHDSEITAIDPVFGNTRVTSYRYGYDASITNLEPRLPVNTSSIYGGIILDFEAYNIDEMTYEWDNNGTEFVLTNPYNITAPNFESLHSLLVKTSDFYENTSFYYEFIFDSDNPVITLLEISDGSIQGPWKVIQVEINDNSGIDTVLYHWDTDTDDIWLPAQGDTYKTNLPITTIWHTLYITANDSYGHQSSDLFSFLTDATIFLVELASPSNNSHLQGDESVIVTARRTNGTIFYQWDGSVLKDGSLLLVSSTIVLNGSDAVPDSSGFQNLTITTYDLSETEYVFYYSFLVDKSNPIIGDLSSIEGKRFESSDSFTFTFTDTDTITSELLVYISIAEKDNLTLVAPNFNVYLADWSLQEGYTNFSIYVFDLAGNYDVNNSHFYIDNIAPVITIVIPNLVYVNPWNYIVANQAIFVNAVDDDPSILIQYNWNIDPFQNYTGSIILPYSDVFGVLRIRAYDSLNHEGTDQIILFIDGAVPDVNIIPQGSTRPDNGDVVNSNTLFEFETTDAYIATVKEVRYYWDLLELWWSDPVPDPSSFVLPILGWYDHNDTATITIRVEDYFGRIALYNFSFTIDIEKPIIDFFYYDKNHILRVLEDGQEYNVEADTELWDNNASTPDLESFDYVFEGEESDSISHLDNWTFHVPDHDGIFTLIVTLVDDVISKGPNTATETYTFVVNDIDVHFVTPENSEWINDTSLRMRMTYADNFTFSVNITDVALGLPIDGLQFRVENNAFSLYTHITNISSFYSCYLEATSVTNDVETRLDFVFYEASAEQTLHLYLQIIKKRGNLSLVEDQSVLSVEYDTNVTIALNLQSHLGTNQSIDAIEVNGEAINHDDIHQIVNSSTFWFYYSTHGMVKGNNQLSINASGVFFFDFTDENFTIELDVIPLTLVLDIQVSNHTVLIDTQLIITFSLSYLNGTAVKRVPINYTIYIFQFSDEGEVVAQIPDNYTSTISDTALTNDEGLYTTSLTMTEEIDYIMIAVSFGGGSYTDGVNFELAERVIKTVPPGFPSWLLYTIIGSSLALIAIVSFVVYKMTRGKPFDEVLESITIDEIKERYDEISPGAILTIFDQRKGPIPLVGAHSLDIPRYLGRMQIGIDNFLLKIADQAYSSLGFEEHDAGRRIGSIILPTEKMIGFVHGVQLPNKMARGGFENLSIIVLADSEYGNLLLNYQENIYDEVDTIIHALKKKKSLKEVEELLRIVRHKSVKIVIAAEKIEEKKA